MENKENKLAGYIITGSSKIEIIKDIVKSKERSKSPEEKTRERELHYRTYLAGRRRDENECRYGKRRRLDLYNRKR